MRRASVPLSRQGPDARVGAGDQGSPRRLRTVRRSIRFRGAVPQVCPRPLPVAGRSPRAAPAHPARTVRRVKWLTPGGLVASAVIGGAVFVGLGLSGFALLVTFFLSGSLLTQIAGGPGGRRNAVQVVANGGVAAVAALFGSWPIAAGALAAATADTWATE